MVRKSKSQSTRSSSRKLPSGLLSCSLGRCASFSAFEFSDSENEEDIVPELVDTELHRPKLKINTQLSPKSPLTSSPRQPTTPRGYLAMYVGEEKQRFLVKTNFLNHPLFSVLLEKAKEEFGFEQQGALNIPCDIAFFRHVMLLVESNDMSSHHRNAEHILLSPVKMDPGSPLLQNQQLTPDVFR